MQNLDPDEAWADAFIAYIGTLPTAEAVAECAMAKATQAIMRRFRRERPELFERVDEATAVRLDVLEGEAPGPQVLH